MNSQRAGWSTFMARHRTLILTAIAVLLVIAGPFLITGMLLSRIDETLPQLMAMSDYRPKLASRVISSDGVILARFAYEDRELARLSEIPETLREAVVAVEDKDFFIHGGIDVAGIMRAALANYRAGRVVQGGSTITQQLARALYLSPEQNIMRKIKEALLSMRIEQRFTKDQILELYLNQIYFGHGAYGAKGAARRFFNKNLSELTLAECAMLAGMPKAPSKYSPFFDLDAATSRKELVLQRMVDVGYINEHEAAQARAEEIYLAPRDKDSVIAPYFIEYLRQRLEERYGTPLVHGGGLIIETPIDTDLQLAAEEAVQKGLLALKKRQGYNDPGEQRADDLHESPIVPGRVYCLPIATTGSNWFEININGAAVRINPGKEGWRLNGRFRDLFAEGRAVKLRAKNSDDNSASLAFSLFQEPEVEGALLAVNPHTGAVLAWVGGYDFQRSRFDRVSQAVRQPGSSFKPIIYAAALDTQFTPADVVYDTPVIKDQGAADAGVWKPMNYDQRFHGATTVRTGLEQSRNVVTVKLLETIGLDRTRRYARLLGISHELEADLSLALGTSAVTLLELTGAYSVFAANGVFAEPRVVTAVTDSENILLEEHMPRLRQVLHPGVAYQVCAMLQGVVTSGTGGRAASLGRPLAGKTGTTQKSWDAWFVGFSPNLLAGVWVGFDEVQTLGSGESGSRTALPIWMDFMQNALETVPVEEFVPPECLSAVLIDKTSGLLAGPNCEKTITEYFLLGTEPQRVCTAHGRDQSSSVTSPDSTDWDSM